jgi:integrase
MPYYKVEGKKKDGLQKYNVRINYISDMGKAKQLTRTAYGLEEAKGLEEKLRQGLKEKGTPSLKKMTFQQLYDECAETKQFEVREGSLDGYKKDMELYILPTFKDVRIDKIDAKMVRDWKVLIEQKKPLKGENERLAFSTKKKIYASLSATLNYAARMDYIGSNPLTKVGNFKDDSTVKKEMDYYTPEQFKLFIETAKKEAEKKQEKNKNLSEWDYYVFFNIAFYTGLRKGEIHALKWSDLTDTHLSVKRSINQRNGKVRETLPKNKSSIRTLQMPLPLIKILNEHKERQKQLKGFSDNFRVCGGERPLRDTPIYERRVKYATLSGLKVIRTHDFRHSHVSLLANERINIQEIARRLGHSRIEMTWNTYSHLYPREEERAVDVLNRLG